MKKHILIIALLLYSLSCIPQSIFSVKPNYIKAGDTESVTITGIKTKFTTINPYNIYFNEKYTGNININYNNYNIINDTSLIVKLNIPDSITPGYRDLIILDEYYSSVYHYGKPNALYIDNPKNNYPRVLSVNPDNANSGQKLDVTITGLNTKFEVLEGTSTTSPLKFLDFNGKNKGIDVDSFKVLSQDTMKIFLNVSQNAIQGYYDLYAINYYRVPLIISFL